MSALLLPNDDREVAELSKQASTIEASAQQITVCDDASMKQASDLLGWIAGTKKSIEERRKFFVSPLNDQVKRINDWFKQMANPLEKADAVLRGKVLAYRQEQERKRREEEERLRKLAEAEQKKLEKKAVKNGTIAPPPPPAPYIPQQAKTVESDFGAVSAKMVWDFEITNETEIPREFLMVNEKAIRAAVKAGVRNIPGVKIFQSEQLAVKAR